MFGYVFVDKPNLLIKDYSLYRAYYCGICKCLGKNRSQLMRLTTSYDITFLDILLHNVFKKTPVLSNEVCILNPFKKKPIVKWDDITLSSIEANDLLMYYKAVDMIADKDKLKGKTLKNLVKKGYKKSRKKYPQLDELLKKQYEKLSLMEKEKETSIDKVADCFAVILTETVKTLSKERFTYDLGQFCYYIGKWIYIIDALDDLDKDFNSGNYNVFIERYGNFKNKKQFIDDNRTEIEFIVAGVYNQIKDIFERLKFDIGDGIMTNIVWYGLNTQSLIVLGRLPECRKTRL